MKRKFNRRNLLKTASIATSLSVVGTIKTNPTGYGPVHLVEAGIKYEFQESHNYLRVHYDGMPLYFVDREEDRLVLSENLSAAANRQLRNNDTIIGTSGIDTAPTRVTTDGEVGALTTNLRQNRQPAEGVVLADRHRPPTVDLTVTDRVPHVVIRHNRHQIQEGQTEEYRLKPETVTAKTLHITDSTAEVKGIPDHRVGPKTESREIEVDVTPVVRVRDHGELSVVRISKQ